MKPKILILDIETSFMELKFKTFSLFNNDVISHKNINVDWYLHCVGYKWLGAKTVKVVSTHDNKKRFMKDHTDDKEVATAIYKVMSQADLIVGHNLDRFDIKKMNTRFIKNGLPPMVMPPTVDTLKAAKKYFSFSSNRLDYIADFLVKDVKMPTETGLWNKTFEGDYKATKQMAKYCKQDINITEKVYMVLRPHMHNHPNLAKIKGFSMKKAARCPVCTSKNNRLDGKQQLKSGPHQYHKCISCGYRFRGQKIKV